MTKKPLRRLGYREVVYDAEHWALLEKFRQKTARIMEALEKFRLDAIVHGSVARSDVGERSDIDVFVPQQPSSFIVETALERAGILVDRRLIVQATPTYAMKAYMEISESTSVSFPLMKMRKVEREFYRFGGEATLKSLRENLRFPGVDKCLMLIEPTAEGHGESAVVGREEYVAKLLGISAETVLDCVHALLRRDEVGGTGGFHRKKSCLKMKLLKWL